MTMIKDKPVSRVVFNAITKQAVLDAMNQLDADEVISSALRDIDKVAAMLDDMIAAWRSGDVAALDTLFLTEMQQYPEMEAILLTKRNHAWMQTLTTLEQNNVMVLVGALHLPGKDGLLHISEVKWERLESMDGVLEPGEEIMVKLIDVDKKTGKFKLSRKVLLPKPEKPVAKDQA